MGTPIPFRKCAWGYNFYEVVFFVQKNCIRLKDLVIFELGFGFLMQNFIYGQMETPGNHQLGLQTKKLILIEITKASRDSLFYGIWSPYSFPYMLSLKRSYTYVTSDAQRKKKGRCN